MEVNGASGPVNSGEGEGERNDTAATVSLSS